MNIISASIIGRDIDRAVEIMQSPTIQARMRVIGDMGSAIVDAYRDVFTRCAAELNESVAQLPKWHL